MRFGKHISLRQTSQRTPIRGSGQVKNTAGGYTWQVSPWQLLDRFLILGTEGGTFYVSESKLTRQHAENLERLIKSEGLKVVEHVATVSESGRAPKNDAAIFALAMCVSFGDEKVRQAAFSALPRVCRTGTHLFQFVAECEELRGWGRGLRKAVGRWYNDAPPEGLTYQAMKYQQRNGWSHRDVLRLAHPKPATEEHRVLYKWAVDGELVGANTKLEAFEALKRTGSVDEAVKLIAEHRLPRECVPTELLVHAEVWEALLADMPLTAMIRNLATMTRCGLLAPASDATKLVIERLRDQQVLRKARVHPLSVLLAHATYATGHGLRGQNTWLPVPRVVDALDEAFYWAFANVEPTNKRYLLGVDVSGSMSSCTVAGSPLSACMAATAMAMVTLVTEPACQTMAFSHRFAPLPLSPKMRLNDAMQYTHNVNFGRTDCALPMRYATEHRLPVDVFVVLTDSETWAGDIHPVQALAQYRKCMGIPAKLVVMGMASNGFTIADPRDPGMLDVVGFDSSVPQAMREFVAA